jgi:hypothetical protein
MARAYAMFLRGAVSLAVLSPSLQAVAAEVVCYVDSVNGDDGKSGLSEAEAVKTQAKLGTTCTIARYKRGSSFKEQVRVTETIKTYTNYGDPNAPLPKFQHGTRFFPDGRCIHPGLPKTSSDAVRTKVTGDGGIYSVGGNQGDAKVQVLA